MKRNILEKAKIETKDTLRIEEEINMPNGKIAIVARIFLGGFALGILGNIFFGAIGAFFGFIIGCMIGFFAK